MSRLPLESMTVEEKPEEMEALWVDLCRNHPDFLSPDWHRDVLEEREAALARGEITCEDFDLAKARILREIASGRDR